MKTKLIVSLIAVLLLLGMTGCKGNSNNSPSPTPSINSKSGSHPTETVSVTPSSPAKDELSESSLLALPEGDPSSYVYVEFEGKIRITAHISQEEVAVIPSKIDGKDVVEIKGAFMNDNMVKAVVIPSEVTLIGDSAFQACSKLESVVFKGDKVSKLGKNAFAVSKKLTTIKLPNSTTEIGEGAFSGCTSLKDITLPSSLKILVVGSFFQTGLENVTIPDGTEKIDRMAFSMCENLKTCIIPASVTLIGDNAFDTSYSKDLIIKTPVGSYAETYAKGNGIKVENQ